MTRVRRNTSGVAASSWCFTPFAKLIAFSASALLAYFSGQLRIDYSEIDETPDIEAPSIMISEALLALQARAVRAMVFLFFV